MLNFTFKIIFGKLKDRLHVCLSRKTEERFEKLKIPKDKTEGDPLILSGENGILLYKVRLQILLHSSIHA